MLDGGLLSAVCPAKSQLQSGVGTDYLVCQVEPTDATQGANEGILEFVARLVSDGLLANAYLAFNRLEETVCLQFGS